MNLHQEKLEKIFSESEKHILRLNSASQKMSSFMPLNKERYEHLSENEIEHVDQFLYRFAKLQDAMGQKLFKHILLFLDEKVENMPFIDILNKLEKLELLENATIWRELRDDRNDLAHNYEDDPEEASLIINKLFIKKDILIQIYNKIKNYYSRYSL